MKGKEIAIFESWIVTCAMRASSTTYRTLVRASRQPNLLLGRKENDPLPSSNKSEQNLYERYYLKPFLRIKRNPRIALV